MLLRSGKEEKARIKVEHVIRDDFMMEANELIELLCETVVARLVREHHIWILFGSASAQ